MDRTASPWRVLDDAAAISPDGGARQPSAEVAAATPGSSEGLATGRFAWRVIAGLIAAAGLAVAAFILAASGSAGGVIVDASSFSPDEAIRPSDGSPGEASGEVVVDIQGAVLRPGVLRLSAGSRIGDAIAAAGGYGPRVDAARVAREINLAGQVHDGDRIVVPSRDDPPGTAIGGSDGAGSSDSGGAGAGGGLVDLNRATASELDALPGVGPVTAQKIIAAREEQPFATIEALRDRKVVGAATFEKLKDLVTVGR